MKKGCPISTIKVVQRPTAQWGMKRALELLNSLADRKVYMDMATNYGDMDFYNDVSAASQILPFAMMFTNSPNIHILHSVGRYYSMKDKLKENGLYGFLEMPTGKNQWWWQLKEIR